MRHSGNNHCVPWQILFVGVAVWALALLLLLCCFLDETQIWLGDLRVVLVVFWLFVCYDLPNFMDQLRPCTNMFLTAYAHVRTEPQRDIGHTRGKKNRLYCSEQRWCSRFALCRTTRGALVQQSLPIWHS